VLKNILILYYHKSAIFTIYERAAEVPLAGRVFDTADLSQETMLLFESKLKYSSWETAAEVLTD